MYLHLSKDNNLNRLTPKIPESACPHHEDVNTKRVCLSNTIEGCASALEDWDVEYYVYACVDDIAIYKPKIKQVIDAKFTGEVWSTMEVNVIKIGKIKVYKNDSTIRYKTYKGNVCIKHYPYEWV